MSLIDNLRKARESTVQADGHTFTIRRPTEAEAIRHSADPPLELVHRFTVAWDLKEIDLVPGGSPEPVPFDDELFAEWVDDKPGCWGPLSEAIIQAYLKHKAAREVAEKN